MSFVRFMLYIEPQDRACLAAMKVCSNIKEPVYIIDVRKLQPRPVWLKGYPSLLDRKHNYLYQGSKCIEFLQRIEIHAPIERPETHMVHLPLNPQHIIIPIIPARSTNTVAAIIEEIPEVKYSQPQSHSVQLPSTAPPSVIRPSIIPELSSIPSVVPETAASISISPESGAQSSVTFGKIQELVSETDEIDTEQKPEDKPEDKPEPSKCVRSSLG